MAQHLNKGLDYFLNILFEEAEVILAAYVKKMSIVDADKLLYPLPNMDHSDCQGVGKIGNIMISSKDLQRLEDKTTHLNDQVSNFIYYYLFIFVFCLNIKKEMNFQIQRCEVRKKEMDRTCSTT